MIEVLDTDITRLDVDAIANAANTHLTHGGGVAGAISRAGGPAVQEESSRERADRPRRGRRDDRRRHAVPLGHPRGDDGARRDHERRRHPPRHARRRCARPTSWARGHWRWSRSARASAASRWTRRPRSRSRRSGRTWRPARGSSASCSRSTASGRARRSKRRSTRRRDRRALEAAPGPDPPGQDLHLAGGGRAVRDRRPLPRGDRLPARRHRPPAAPRGERRALCCVRRERRDGSCGSGRSRREEMLTVLERLHLVSRRRDQTKH